MFEQHISAQLLSPSNLCWRQPVSLLMKEHLTKKRYDIDKHVVRHGQHVLQKLPSESLYILRINVLRWKQRLRNNWRTQIRKERCQHLGHGVHADLLKRRTIIQAFSDPAYLVRVPPGHEKVAFVQTSFVEGIDDAPQLLWHWVDKKVFQIKCSCS